MMLTIYRWLSKLFLYDDLGKVCNKTFLFASKTDYEADRMIKLVTLNHV